MMLLKLKRNWFGPNGVRYRARDGLHQVPEAIAAQAPSDAVVYDDNGMALPSRGAKPLPGYGAKPLHEQLLDTIPGAGVSHVEKSASGGSIDNPVGMSDEDREKAEKEAEKDREKQAEAEHKEEQSKVTEALKKVPELEENIQKATDPVAEASKTGPAPKPQASPTKK